MIESCRRSIAQQVREISTQPFTGIGSSMFYFWTTICLRSIEILVRCKAECISKLNAKLLDLSPLCFFYLCEFLL